MDKLHSCFQQCPFLESRSVYYSVHFSVFCSCFSAFRRNDFGVEPVPSLQASGKLFWDARIISGASKHNLPCSLEHEFFIRKIKIWRSIHFPPIKSFRRHPYHFLNTQDDIQCHRPSADRHDSANPEKLSLFCRMSACVRQFNHPSVRQVHGVWLP